MVLSLEGGGNFGYATALGLAEAESYLQKKYGKEHALRNLFDLIVGTSAGGVIASALANPDENLEFPNAPGEIVEQWKTLGRVLFKRPLFHKIRTGFGLWGPIYPGENVQKACWQGVGRRTKLSETKPDLVISTMMVSPIVQGYLFRTSDARAEPQDNDFSLASVVGATLAIPVCFPPSIVKKNKRLYKCIDGGVMLGNPVFHSVLEGMKVLENRSSKEEEKTEVSPFENHSGNLHVLSVELKYISVEETSQEMRIGKGGIAQWGPLILRDFMIGHEQLINQQLSLLPKSMTDCIHRIIIPVSFSARPDDIRPKNFDLMDKIVGNNFVNVPEESNLLHKAIDSIAQAKGLKPSK